MASPATVGGGKGPKERPLAERFEAAVIVIRSLPKDGPFQPSDMVKLKFYGLYKVVKEGPNNASKPGIWDPTGRAKWEAWKMCSNLDKEKAMTMYIQELEQIIETMPQTKQVEEFMKSIGPFYDFVDEEEEDNTNEEKKTKEEEETIPSVKRVTFSDQPSSNDDSDGELEFEDSYDNLPSSVTPLKSSHSLMERRPTPYIHSQGTCTQEQPKSDALSTNLFQSPNNNDSLSTAQASPTEQSHALYSLITQLIHNTQVLTHQFGRLLDQNLTQSQRNSKRILLSVIGSFVISIIFKYWGTRYATDSTLYWLTMTACHVVINLVTQYVC